VGPVRRRAALRSDLLPARPRVRRRQRVVVCVQAHGQRRQQPQPQPQPQPRPGPGPHAHARPAVADARDALSLPRYSGIGVAGAGAEAMPFDGRARWVHGCMVHHELQPSQPELPCGVLHLHRWRYRWWYWPCPRSGAANPGAAFADARRARAVPVDGRARWVHGCMVHHQL